MCFMIMVIYQADEGGGDTQYCRYDALKKHNLASCLLPRGHLGTV